MDISRRKFLKLIFVGSGAFLLEKVMGPLFSKFLDNSSVQTNPPAKTNFRNFKITEDSQILSVYDSSGEEVFQIDNRV
ncbi:MAG: hypothetical protein NTW60_02775 [Candidatus Wolfebacteria bacterium]|nr:hypothetical protein [Candidatus Wolfebacteria bacterium]